jgi:cob(I)alamin adenosyltransferase
VKIYTKTGDAGETSLFDGTRVPKTDPRVVAYGEVDELQATIGVARAAGLEPDLDEMCVTLQRDLFAVGARLADPSHRIAARVEKAVVTDTHVAALEAWIDRLDAEVPPLRHFILSGGGTPARRCTWRAPSAGAPSGRSSPWVPRRWSRWSSSISTACRISSS